MKSNLNKSSADEKTNATLSITSTQCQHKCNEHLIDVIKSQKKKIKTPLWGLLKNQDDKKKQLKITGPQIKVMIPSTSIFPGLSNASSIKQKLTLSPVPSIRSLANHDLQSSPFNPESNKEQYIPSLSLND